MLHSQSKQIDEFAVEVTQLPAMRAFKLLARIGRALGPALADLGAALGGGKLGDLDLGAAGRALARAFEGLPDAELEAITRGLLDEATLDGKPMLATMDVVLMGRVDVLMRALLFAAEVNYGSFGRALRAVVGKSPAAGGAPLSAKSTA